MKTTQALEDPTEDNEAADCRERATAALDEISRQVKQALAEAEIDLNLFFLVNSRPQHLDLRDHERPSRCTMGRGVRDRGCDRSANRRH